MGQVAASGHRTVPHTADLRIEAWAPTADQCLAEAVNGMVEGFADLSGARSEVGRDVLIEAADAEEQLAALLNEVIFRMDTDGELPRAVEVRRAGPGLRVHLSMVDAAEAVPIGAVPKAVSLHGLRFGREGTGWSCSVTLDV